MNSSNEHINLRGGAPWAGKTAEEIRFTASLRYGLAILSVGVALGVGLLLQNFDFRVPAATLLLFAVAIASWYAGRGPAVLALILAITSCYWFFVEPVRTIYINYSDIPFFLIFTGFAVLLCWFGTIRRRTEADLRQSRDVLSEQASLLNLTHDAVYVRDMQGVISYWNRGAEMLYGWSREHALGKIARELLNTNFPLPVEQIEAELLQTGRWDGELTKTKKDGTQVVVASRWALKRDDRSAPAAILVTSNDITERKRAEAELRASEERFRTLVQFSFDVYWESDAQHRFTRQEFAEGLADAPAPGSEIGKARWQIPYLEPDEAAWQEHRATMDAHLPFRDFELARPTPDGGKRYVSVSGLPVFDEAGHFLGYRGVGRHITERKRAEEELRRLNRELRAISDCNQALLRATDEPTLLKDICRIVCEGAGYRMAWVGYADHDEPKSVRPVAWAGVEDGYLTSVGITWADTQHGRGPTGTAVRNGVSCCVQDFATDPRVAPWRHGALQRGFRSGIGLPLKDEHGRVFGSLTIHSSEPNAFTVDEIQLLEELAGDLAFGIVTLRSAAARKRAEQEVSLLSFALNNVHETAFLIDEGARFHYVNAEGCQVLGYTYAELLGMAVPDIDPGFPAERWAEHWRDLQTHRSLIFESRHRTREGRVFPVEVSANYFEYGGRAYNLALARDVTNRLKAEEQRDRLRQLEAELAHINRVSTMGELAASIAHEVGQPLVGVVNNGSACLRWLARDVPNLEEAREAARRIVRDGKRAGDIIARVRALTKKAATPNETLALNETIQDVLALVGDEAKRKSVNVQTKLADDLSPVSGDRVQLQQLVLNLVLNGIEAMSSVSGRARELVITTRNLEPDQVQVTVEDSGTGLAPDVRDKIFDPFYTTKPGGMGMGLSISRSIIEAHGGRLWAADKDGPGTMFHFTLPRCDEEKSRA